MGIKYSVDEKIFDKWGSSMAYILGYIFADGSLENSPYIRAQYLRISSTDLDTLVTIKKFIGSSHKLVLTKPPPNYKQKYLLRIGNKKLYTSLEKFGLYPNKSLTVRFPEVPVKYFGDFIRGYFDGDGCVHIERSSGNSIRCVRTIFTSGSRKFLLDLSDSLSRYAGVSLKGIYKSSRSFQLRYNTRDSEKLFDLMYKNRPEIFMVRKFKKFIEYKKLKQKREVGKRGKIYYDKPQGLVAKG